MRVHTALESHNCAATSDQSSITTKLRYMERDTPVNTITLAHPVKPVISNNSAKDRLNTTPNESLAGHAIAARPIPVPNTYRGLLQVIYVGGNPTMNTPRLRRGGGIASSSFFFFFYLYWYSYIVYFVCDSASEFETMGSTSFFGGFSYPNLLFFF